MAPSGQMETEFNFRFSQAKKMAKAIAKIQMTRPESTIAYQSRWLSIVGFFTPITCFSRKMCEKIQVPIYQAFLPKMGYNRHLPLAIRYGPTNLGGAGLVHLYTEQAIKHVQFLVGTVRQKSQLADTFIIALSTIQLTAGTTELFLNKKKRDMTYVEGNTAICSYGRYVITTILHSR